MKKKKSKGREVEITIKYNTNENDPTKYGTPKALVSWDVDCPMSAECKTMMDKLSDIASYICLQLNDGPDVKDSITRRAILLKHIIYQLLHGTWLNGYTRYGLVAEMMHDMYLDTSGKGKIIMTIAEFEALKAAQKREAIKGKTRYVA